MRLTLKLFLLFALSLSYKPLLSEEPGQKGKVVFITGASRGVGLAAAERLARDGFHVYAGVRNLNNLTPQKNLHFELLDILDSTAIQSVVQKIIQKEGSLDILINNAGFALGGPVECLSMEEIKEQMDVNFFSVIRMCQAILPQMRKQKAGRIINISSEQGVYGLPYGSLYTASKAALESLSEALSIEVLPWNIKVSIVEPGLLKTRFSIKMGSRTVIGNPYQKIVDIIQHSLDERNAHPELLPSGQSPEEIAQFLQKVIEDPQPQLRYQTSKSAEDTVAECIKDVSGKEYLERMKSQTAEAYKEAWSSEDITP